MFPVKSNFKLSKSKLFFSTKDTLPKYKSASPKCSTEKGRENNNNITKSLSSLMTPNYCKSIKTKSN